MKSAVADLSAAWLSAEGVKASEVPYPIDLLEDFESIVLPEDTTSTFTVCVTAGSACWTGTNCCTTACGPIGTNGSCGC